MASDLLNDSPALQDGKLLVEEASSEPVYKIEWNLWKNREVMEEIMYLLSRLPQRLQKPSTHEDSDLATLLHKIANMFEKSSDILVCFQDMISERVLSSVTSLLPRCIREIIIRQHKNREIKAKESFDDLVTSEASTSARYTLLWEKEKDIRIQLKQVCSSVGFCQIPTEQNEKSVLKVVLDSFPTIDDEDWPMEEQGERYGQPLFGLTTMILSIQLYLSLLLGRYEDIKLKRDQVTVLNQAIDVYTCEFEKFITFISEQFEGSPLFISADVGPRIDDFKEIVLSALETHEVSLEVDIKSNIAWDFFLVFPGDSLSSVKWDIEFSVKCKDASGNYTIILPKKQCWADKGSFVALDAGNYKLIWDNRHMFFTKFLCYKLECTPVVDGEL